MIVGFRKEVQRTLHASATLEVSFSGATVALSLVDVVEETIGTLTLDSSDMHDF